MILFNSLLLLLLAHFTLTHPLEDVEGDPGEEGILSRHERSRDGKFHPEHSHSHSVSHSHSGPEGSGGFVNVNGLQLNFGDEDKSYKGVQPELLQQPLPQPQPLIAPPPTKTMEGPNGYANCGCVPFNQCPQSVLIGMPALLSTLKNDVVCGQRFTLCCLEDPWAGPIDQWADQVPCIAEEICVRPYGSDPYDIQNYGTIGPCLGLGSVRCLDNRPPGPTTVIVPIVDFPVPPTPPILPPTTPPTPPPIYIPPETLPPATTPPPVVYEPPTVYEPPAPTPQIVYEPPAPTTVYEPPVETYQPPVETYEPPVQTYEPPTPTDTYEPPSVSYGVPPGSTGVARYPPRRYGGYGGWGGYPRYGYGGFGGYPGYGFRKHFSFSKGFYG